MFLYLARLGDGFYWDATGYSWSCACSAIRRLAGKGAPNIDFRFVAKVVYSIVALLIFGGGFALITAGNFVLGLALGVIGLVLIIGIIPVTVGLKNKKS